MLLTEIDHVAIAVKDLDAAIDYYARAFGAEVHHREIVDSDGVEEALVKVADSYIQLTGATRDDSPIAKFLEKRGEGLHHIGGVGDELRRQQYAGTLRVRGRGVAERQGHDHGHERRTMNHGCERVMSSVEALHARFGLAFGIPS